MIVKCDLVAKIFWIKGSELFLEVMPSDIVSVAVSTGLGISVLAGILSGVCYVFTQGVRAAKNKKGSQEWYCSVCGRYLRSIEGVLEGNRVISCSKCQNHVCKTKCSQNHLTLGWVCQNCDKPDSWLQGILNLIQPKASEQIGMEEKVLKGLEEELKKVRENERKQVRDFIERLVNAMLGENVDEASVTRIFNDRHYLPITGESPCSAHATLKRLIQNLLREAVDLPRLQEATPHPAVPETETRSYEDLLSSAIINKVVGSCQNNRPCSSANSVSSRHSNSSRRRVEKEYFFSEETLDNKWKTTDLDTTSISSLEDWIASDSSRGSTKYVDRVNLTIKQDILETDSEDDNDSDQEQDDSEYFRNNLLAEDDANWFLQKRQFQGTHSPVPVPMLVPDPSTEAKVLIGDREIDDTSDLSDVASDYGETENVLEVKNLLVESKNIIGGKNIVKKISNSEDELSADSGVREERDVETEPETEIYASKKTNDMDIVKTDKTVDDDNVEDASINSIYSNTEKDTEYTESYASLPRTITLRSKTSYNNPKTSTSEHYQDGNEDEDYSSLEFSGSYSKKEKEKWNHPIAMDNNPYTKENLEKRIKKSSNTFDYIFGPDYYAKQAAKPSGTLKKHEFQFNESDEEERLQPQILHSNKEEDPIIPVELRSFPEKPTSTPPELDSIDLTSDSDLSLINCYNVPAAEISKGYPIKPKEVLSEMNTSTTVSKQNQKQLHNETKKEPANVEKPKVIPFKKKDEIPQSKPKYQKHYFATMPSRRSNSLSDLLQSPDQEPDSSGLFINKKKKDNTLLSKIYQNSNVLNFALKSRNSVPIPVQDEAHHQESFKRIVQRVLSTPGDFKPESKPSIWRSVSINALSEIPKENSPVSESKEDSLTKDEMVAVMNFSSESTYEESEEENSVKRGLAGKDIDPVIQELEQASYVKDILSKFQKEKPKPEKNSVPYKKSNIEDKVKDDIDNKINYNDNIDVMVSENRANEDMKTNKIENGSHDEEIITISVSKLRQKYEQIENKSKQTQPVSSITARSIPRLMRQQLKQ